MPWLKLTLNSNPEQSEIISDLLEEQGAQAITLIDAEDQPLYEPLPGEIPLWNKMEITGLFEADKDIESLRQALSSKLPYSVMESFRASPLEDKDWSRVWMDEYHPMQFGENLWIVPSWTPAPDPDATNILLDPGLAFGTGTHPTTAMCLRWLDGQDLSGQQVLDYGCGSGILAIAAAKLGAESILGIDIDPQALIATQSNAERNEVSDKIETSLPIDLEQAHYDRVLANILAGPLESLAPLLCGALKSGGQLVLSGILAQQADTVRHAYAQFCNMDSTIQDGDWIRLSGTRH